MAVIVRGVVDDRVGTHAIAMIVVAGQIVPAILHMIALTIIIIFVGSATAVGKRDPRRLMARAILIDGGSDAGEQVIARTISRRKRGVGTGAIAKGAFLVGKTVAIIQMSRATIVANVGLDGLQR